MAKVGVQDLRKCLKIYYECHEIGNKEIGELLGVKAAKAVRLKKDVREEMARRNVMAFDKSCVNTEIAFEVWGIDINDVERRLKKLEKLGLLKKEGCAAV